MKGDAVDNRCRPVQVAQIADVARLSNGCGQADRGRRRRGGVFRSSDTGATKDGPSKFVDVFVRDVPQIGDQSRAASK